MPDGLKISPYLYAVFAGAVVIAMLDSTRTVTGTLAVFLIPARW